MLHLSVVASPATCIHFAGTTSLRPGRRFKAFWSSVWIEVHKNGVVLRLCNKCDALKKYPNVNIYLLHKKNPKLNIFFLKLGIVISWGFVIESFSFFHLGLSVKE